MNSSVLRAAGIALALKATPQRSKVWILRLGRSFEALGYVSSASKVLRFLSAFQSGQIVMRGAQYVPLMISIIFLYGDDIAQAIMSGMSGNIFVALTYLPKDLLAEIGTKILVAIATRIFNKKILCWALKPSTASN